MGVYNDAVSSVSQRTALRYCAFSDAFFRGRMFVLPPNDPGFHWGMSSSINDVITSVRPCTDKDLTSAP